MNHKKNQRSGCCLNARLASLLASSSAVALCLAWASPAQADITTYFGEDDHSSNPTSSAPRPNSDAAQSAFFGQLSGVGTDNLESYTTGQTSFTATFPVPSGTVTAAVNAPGTGIHNDHTQGELSTDQHAESGNQYLYMPGNGTASITFNAPIAAFGFFGSDVGDFGGKLEIKLYNGSTLITTLTAGNLTAGGAQNGNDVYFGFIDTTTTDQINKIVLSSSNTGDNFGFDDFSVGTLDQVSSVPESSTIIAGAMTLLPFGAGAFRSLRKKFAK